MDEVSFASCNIIQYMTVGYLLYSFINIFYYNSQGSLATVTADKGQPAIVPEVEIDFGGGSDFTVEAAVGKDDANEITMSVQVRQGQR